jgi:DNA-binding transcriptional regulator/RsmH inhibitor MraZ
MGNKMELWDKDTYTKYLNQKTPGFGKLASEIRKDYGNLF